MSKFPNYHHRWRAGPDTDSGCVSWGRSSSADDVCCDAGDCWVCGEEEEEEHDWKL